MTGSTLHIYENNKINYIFVKANAYILDKYQSSFHCNLNIEEKNNLLETLWYEEFNVDIEKRVTSSILFSEKWKSIKFKNANAYSLFLLRWS